MANVKKTKLENFVLDVDGVFTTGQFLYTSEGKFAKIFGPHDSDGIKILKDKIKIRTITADIRGFGITNKRISEDMGLKLDLVREEDREKWFLKNFNLDTTVFMGDGIFDAAIFDIIGYSIAPKNAFYLAKKKANFVTRHNSGEGAVAEACLHLLKKFRL